MNNFKVIACGSCSPNILTLSTSDGADEIYIKFLDCNLLYYIIIFSDLSNIESSLFYQNQSFLILDKYSLESMKELWIMVDLFLKYNNFTLNKHIHYYSHTLFIFFFFFGW
jgi:hypothetical protein